MVRDGSKIRRNLFWLARWKRRELEKAWKAFKRAGVVVDNVDENGKLHWVNSGRQNQRGDTQARGGNLDEVPGLMVFTPTNAPQCPPGEGAAAHQHLHCC